MLRSQPYSNTSLAICISLIGAVASDYCEPCPTNGICYDGKLECDHGYQKHGRLCLENGDVNIASKKLSKWVEVRLCEAYAQLLCSGTGKSWVSEDELQNYLDEYKMRDNHALGEAIYMPAKQRAIATISNLFDRRKDNQGVEEFKCTELLVNHYKPLSCAARQWIVENASLLLPACILFMGCILIASRAYQRHHLSVRAEQIYHEVCDILEEKPLVSRSEGEGETWVVAPWLRDHLLSPKERKDPFLWRKVEKLVQEDSRIDQYPKLVKGESKVPEDGAVNFFQDGYLGIVEALCSINSIVVYDLSFVKNCAKPADCSCILLSTGSVHFGAQPY
ncbi:UNVERIFIED_CONTAM: hypothetical protein Scaly_2437800 [Sesamum calycinum]|uniref:Man1/Src1-like C-terminal domain-containing protein n=1 Tax=Sesamum calycinum TaxID=2727403 RepID=A0AAW2LZG5_9LAMI